MVVRTTEEINHDGFKRQQIDVTVRTLYFRGKKADNPVKRETKKQALSRLINKRGKFSITLMEGELFIFLLARSRSGWMKAYLG